MLRTWLMLLACLALQAQQRELVRESVGGPETVFWFDSPTQSIRNLRGFAGAAVAGAVQAGDVPFAQLAPNGRTAVIQRQDGRYYWIQDLQRLEEAVPLAIRTADLSAWSADSKCLATYDAESGFASRVCNTQPLDPPIAVGRGMQTMALNRDGSALATGGKGSLVHYSQVRGLQSFDTVSPRSIAFRENGDSVLVADATTDSVVEYAANEFRTIVNASQLQGEPLQAVDTFNGGIAVVTQRHLVQSNHDGSALRHHALETAAFGSLRRIGPQQYLSSRDSSGGVLFLVDFSRAEVLFFVPVTEK